MTLRLGRLPGRRPLADFELNGNTVAFLPDGEHAVVAHIHPRADAAMPDIYVFAETVQRLLGAGYAVTAYAQDQRPCVMRGERRSLQQIATDPAPEAANPPGVFSFTLPRVPLEDFNMILVADTPPTFTITPDDEFDGQPIVWFLQGKEIPLQFFMAIPPEGDTDLFAWRGVVAMKLATIWMLEREMMDAMHTPVEVWDAVRSVYRAIPA